MMPLDKIADKVVETDVFVIGGGIAGSPKRVIDITFPASFW